ncbi:hypothetical protein PSa2_00019 [Escherichia phage PSa2]|uniref:Uncharacterized protein n=2 Tax=Epseptimavirus TaxID=2732017 RepID=B2I457_9CAUD|nr:hypothetical protein AGC_0019 [Escherichia phage Eps7]ACB97462.1 Hypothetical protein AGC_0019 [Escherichia phage Eps7]UIR90600.1 hypothetical protein PSa2_00019 [Escherichia phage PSa2]UQT65325.1 hypothetical protein BD13_185 [Salmonella phage BD13]
MDIITQFTVGRCKVAQLNKFTAGVSSLSESEYELRDEMQYILFIGSDDMKLLKDLVFKLPPDIKITPRNISHLSEQLGFTWIKLEPSAKSITELKPRPDDYI